MSVAFWTAWRTLRSRLGAVLITLLAIALATATALVVPLVVSQVERGAKDAAQVSDLLIAAPGSATQALMSSIFYLDTPTGNIPEHVYTNLLNAPGTARAVPLALGDQYLGFPIVGTSPQFFEQTLGPTYGPYYHIAQGKMFSQPFDAVIGAGVAQQAGLHIGDTFVGQHGLSAEEASFEAEEEDENDPHHHPFTVVGIMQATGGPADRAVLTPLETVWLVHEHEHEHGDQAAQPAETQQAGKKEEREVTAVLYAADDLSGIYTTAAAINAGGEAMAVFPGQVFAQASNTLNQGQAAYAALSLLVLGIAALTVWLSVYTAGLERQRSVALLRALGAGRGTVFGLVLLETLLTVVLGVLVGIALTLIISQVGGQLLGARLGFTIGAPKLTWPLALWALALIPLGALAALPPAIAATRQSPVKFL